MTLSDLPPEPLSMRMSTRLAGALRKTRLREERVSRYGRSTAPGTPWPPSGPRWRAGTWPVTTEPCGSPTASTATASTAPISGFDDTHAHLNMPAGLMWGRGLEERPATVRFEPPPDRGWRVATQLYPTDDPFVYTAPNLQYPARQPRRGEPLRGEDVHRRRSRRPRLSAGVPHRHAPHGRRWRVRPLRRGCRAHRARDGDGVRRVPALRDGPLHIHRRLSALGVGRRHGAPEQHRAERAGDVARRPLAPARLGVPRVLPRLERGAHPPPVLSSRSTSRTSTPSGELWLAEGFTNYYGGADTAAGGARRPARHPPPFRVGRRDRRSTVPAGGSGRRRT